MDRSSSSRRFGVLALVIAMVSGVLSLSAVEVSAAPPPKQPPIEGTVAHPPVPAVPPIVSEDPLPNAGPLAPPAPPSTEDALPTDVDLALEQAASSGQRVEIQSLRSETATVYATPKGTLSEELSMVPVRVQSGDGWVPVDETLQVGAEQRLSPKSVPGSVSVSPGGSGPLIASGPDGKRNPDGSRQPSDQRVTLSLPGQLPAPQVNGSTSLYPKADRGADVRVEARASGTTVSWIIPDPASVQAAYTLNLTTAGLTPSRPRAVD